jgi:hypothetical protein
MHTTRVRFMDGGPEHEVNVGRSTSMFHPNEEELWVDIDRKHVVQSHSVIWDLHS